jgi:hypothetical protein
MNRNHALVLALVFSTGCAADDLSTQQQDVTFPARIDSVTDVGVSADARHYFEIRGDFPNPSAGYSYRSHVVCNGENFPSSIYPGWISTQMNVSIPNYPSETPLAAPSGTGAAIASTTCWFMIEVSKTLDRTGPVYSNTFGPISYIKITSATNLGISGGRQSFALYGSFPAPSTSYTSAVQCNGATVASQTIDLWSATQISISFPSQSSTASCTLRVKRGTVASMGWPVRVGPSAPDFPASVGAYFWGGHQPPSSPDALLTGVASLRDMGMRKVIRLFLSPRLRAAGGNNTRGRNSEPTQRILADYFSDNAYNLDLRIGDPVTLFCPVGASPDSFLPCAAKSPYFQLAFNQYGSGSTIILTVSDVTAFGDYGAKSCSTFACNMDETFLNVNAVALAKEYEDLTYALYQTQHDTGKTFIIDDWETDSQLYQYGPYNYGQRRQGATCGSCPTGLVCDSGTNGSNKCVDPLDTYSNLLAKKKGLKRWFELRRQGIATGKLRAQQAGLGGLTVGDGIEIASFHILQDLSEPDFNTLDDIIRVAAPNGVQPDYVSYSAWDSTERGTVDEDLAAIKGQLAALSPAPTLIMGETGVKKMHSYSWRFRETIRAAYRAQLPAIVTWQGFDTKIWLWPCACVGDGQGGCLETPPALYPEHYPDIPSEPPLAHNDDGLLTVEGAESALASSFRANIIDYAATGVLPPQATQINTVTDYGVYNNLHSFAFWGAFPAGTIANYSVSVVCDSIQWPASVVYVEPDSDGDGQVGHINVSINDPGPGSCSSGARLGVWCTFALTRAGMTSSPVFGPRHLCQGTQPSDGKDWAGQCLNVPACSPASPPLACPQ